MAREIGIVSSMCASTTHPELGALLLCLGLVDIGHALAQIEGSIFPSLNVLELQKGARGRLVHLGSAHNRRRSSTLEKETSTKTTPARIELYGSCSGERANFPQGVKKS